MKRNEKKRAAMAAAAKNAKNAKNYKKTRSRASMSSVSTPNQAAASRASMSRASTPNQAAALRASTPNQAAASRASTPNQAAALGAALGAAPAMPLSATSMPLHAECANTMLSVPCAMSGAAPTPSSPIPAMPIPSAPAMPLPSSSVPLYAEGANTMLSVSCDVLRASTPNQAAASSVSTPNQAAALGVALGAAPAMPVPSAPAMPIPTAPTIPTTPAMPLPSSSMPLPAMGANTMLSAPYTVSDRTAFAPSPAFSSSIAPSPSSSVPASSAVLSSVAPSSPSAAVASSAVAPAAAVALAEGKNDAEARLEVCEASLEYRDKNFALKDLQGKMGALKETLIDYAERYQQMLVGGSKTVRLPGVSLTRRTTRTALWQKDLLTPERLATLMNAGKRVTVKIDPAIAETASNEVLQVLRDIRFSVNENDAWVVNVNQDVVPEAVALPKAEGRCTARGNVR